MRFLVQPTSTHALVCQVPDRGCNVWGMGRLKRNPLNRHVAIDHKAGSNTSQPGRELCPGRVKLRMSNRYAAPVSPGSGNPVLSKRTWKTSRP